MNASQISGDTSAKCGVYDEYDKYYDEQIAHKRPVTISA